MIWTRIVNTRAGGGMDRRGVHLDLPAVSRFITTELFIGLEIDDGPAVGSRECEIDDALDEGGARVAPYDRHFTAAATLLRRLAGLIQ